MGRLTLWIIVLAIATILFVAFNPSPSRHAKNTDITELELFNEPLKNLTESKQEVSPLQKKSDTALENTSSYTITRQERLNIGEQGIDERSTVIYKKNKSADEYVLYYGDNTGVYKNSSVKAQKQTKYNYTFYTYKSLSKNQSNKNKYNQQIEQIRLYQNNYRLINNSSNTYKSQGNASIANVFTDNFYLRNAIEQSPYKGEVRIDSRGIIRNFTYRHTATYSDTRINYTEHVTVTDINSTQILQPSWIQTAIHAEKQYDCDFSDTNSIVTASYPKDTTPTITVSVPQDSKSDIIVRNKTATLAIVTNKSMTLPIKSEVQTFTIFLANSGCQPTPTKQIQVNTRLKDTDVELLE